MLDLNYLYGSVLFYLICKLVSLYFDRSMYNKSKALTSIPENNESEVDLAATKWVPKKKHEVLKAKYKCLKKLFQIYDASVIGILPETYGQGDGFSVEERDPDARKSRRKKRSHRTRTDACAGTADLSSEISEPVEAEETATAVMRDLKIDCSNTMTAQTGTSKSNTTVVSEFKQNSVVTSKECFSNSSVHECGCAKASAVPFQHPAPYYMSERRKPTRFQNFLQRLLGIRREQYKGVWNGHVLAASDNDINQLYVEKRRRRGLRSCRRRYRRLRRPKRVQSEGALRETPLLDYAQAVQRNCLMDTTPRQCPIAGCRMIFYGIINYNDHLNLCHFTERRFICHFCHEGFGLEADKLQHESEHIGLSRLTPLVPTPATQRSVATTSDTQTDPPSAPVPEEKLKKIVSFFDKIADSDQILADIKQNRYSESNLKSPTVVSDSGHSSASTVKRMSSCLETCTRSRPSLFGVKCNFCGEKFECRRQLSLHVDLEHRVHDRFSKFHSCAGMVGRPRAAPGQLAVTSAASTLGCPSSITEDLTRTNSEATDVSVSEECSQTSVAASIVERLRGVNVKWEPGTRIIRV